jgi:hypothetical protein
MAIRLQTQMKASLFIFLLWPALLCYASFPADFDHSDTVDFSDLVILAGQWLSEPNGLPSADLNFDKIVDYTDFALFAAEWQLPQNMVIIVSGTAGIDGVVMSGLPGNPFSHNGGLYSAAVPYGWSGSITPVKTGYVFSPLSVSYTNVTTDLPDRNFTAEQLVSYTISGTTGIDGVTMSGLPGNPVTAGGGLYSIVVPAGWSGTVMPILSGETFNPIGRYYAGVAADQNDQDYTAISLPTFTISGTTGVGGVALYGFPDNPISDNNGFYSAIVPYNWSGTVTPAKAGYGFSPSSVSYTDITSDLTGRNYTAIPLIFTISGTTGVGGVTLYGFPDNPISDNDGFYSAIIPYNWSGTVTPAKANYGFSPSSVSYTNVTSDLTARNYTATPLTFTISGTAGISGVSMNGLPGNPVTNGSGFYSAIVPYNWGGTVTPTIAGYTFDPVSKLYTNVVVDTPSQDYVCTPEPNESNSTGLGIWKDDDATAAKVWNPLCLFRGKVICAEQWNVGKTYSGWPNGIILTDGVTSEIGAQPNNCAYLNNAWGIDDIGLFVCVNTTGQTLQKSPDGKLPFVTITVNGQPMQAKYSLERSLVDCGRHFVSDGQGGRVEKRILLYFARTTDAEMGNDRVYVSATENDAAAGDDGTWTDLYGKTTPGIDHHHGGVYIKGKGLYVMTGDSYQQSSILFCSEADIGSLVDDPLTWYNRWALGKNDRNSWTGTVKTDYILAGYGEDWRTVDIVTANKRYAYFMCDAEPQALINQTGSQRIYKIDLYDTNDCAAGKIHLLKGDGILNFGWYGGVSQSGLIFFTTSPYSGTTNWMQGCNGIMEIYCIDSNTEEVKLVKRISALPPVVFANNAAVNTMTRLMEFNGSMIANFTAGMISPLDYTGDRWNSYALICGKVLRRGVTDTNSFTPTNIITATTLANTFYPSTTSSLSRNRIAFNSGSSVIAPGDDIRGGTSGATATLLITTPVTITNDPSWSGATTGNFQITNIHGVFREGEDILVGPAQIPSAKITGFCTWEIVDSTQVPAGWNGEAVRYAGVAKSLPSNAALLLKLSGGQAASIRNGFVTYSCRVWIDPNTYVGTNSSRALWPSFYFQIRSCEWSNARAWKGALKTGEWITLYCSTYVGNGLTNFFFYPNITTNSGNTIRMYIADFQLVNGAEAEVPDGGS